MRGHSACWPTHCAHALVMQVYTMCKSSSRWIRARSIYRLTVFTAKPCCSTYILYLRKCSTNKGGEPVMEHFPIMIHHSSGTSTRHSTHLQVHCTIIIARSITGAPPYHIHAAAFHDERLHASVSVCVRVRVRVGVRLCTRPPFPPTHSFWCYGLSV